jgi:hypothetical protein
LLILLIENKKKPNGFGFRRTFRYFLSDALLVFLVWSLCLFLKDLLCRLIELEYFFLLRKLVVRNDLALFLDKIPLLFRVTERFTLEKFLMLNLGA